LPAQERSPIVEVLEERLMKAAEERCAAAIGAAAADDAEELRAPEAAVAAALGVLSRGARPQYQAPRLNPEHSCVHVR
jgi:hypothetical protein